MDTGIVVGVGGLLTAAVAALITLLTFLSKSKRVDERSAIAYYRRLIDDMQAQLDRHGVHMTDQTRIIELLRRQVGERDIDIEALWGEMVRRHDHEKIQHACAMRCMEALRKLGGDCGDPPDPLSLPQRPRRDGPDAGFAARQAQANTALLRELDDRTKQQPLPPEPSL